MSLATEGLVRSILEKHKTVAVVGLSREPSKDSYQVAQYLKLKGYRIVPINPFADEILEERCYSSLLEMPETLQEAVEIVDIFRPTEDVPLIVDQAIQLRGKVGNPQVIWMQLGIAHEVAARKAKEAGFLVVMDRCMKIEYAKLLGGSPGIR